LHLTIEKGKYLESGKPRFYRTFLNFTLENYGITVNKALEEKLLILDQIVTNKFLNRTFYHVTVPIQMRILF
jgi:hypothetical protein